MPLEATRTAANKGRPQHMGDDAKFFIVAQRPCECTSGPLWKVMPTRGALTRPRRAPALYVSFLSDVSEGRIAKPGAALRGMRRAVSLSGNVGICRAVGRMP